ncbi:MAG TPA: alpha/beta hydrolase [Acidimicrobiales bacterium]|nr:alpha/beta hydrolase [Acidimicrobiales bacterium]
MRAQEWLEAGQFFGWRPPDEDGNDTTELKIFHAEFGDRDAPVIALVHGFPTSSIDWYDVVPRLTAHHRVCVLDFPGFGFSDKPKGARYTVARDALLLDHYLRDIVGAERGAVVAHDRGDSVALTFAARCQDGSSPFDVAQLVLSNGNIFLPLSNLTRFQRLVLHADTAPAVLEATTPEALAVGMGQSTFTPPRSLDDPAIAALAATFAHNDGTAVLHDTIQYLVERSQHEEEWLEALARSSVPTTLIWGLHDTVSPPRVATHVWNAHLARKPGLNELWFLPHANHYLQEDDSEGFAEIVTRVLDGRSPEAPGALTDDPRAPILVDRSRSRLPSAMDVLVDPGA